ncbi:MAG: NUDIX domain-containing protein [Victivallales bacterium]|jgi:isopentenyldiphosphate isomerase
MMHEEIFEIVDEDNRVVGTAKRSECHGNPALIHRTAHVIVFHPDGRILLQKRSMEKDVQPGKWDTAVGGHLMPGEEFETAARREMAEELGIPENLPLKQLFDSKIRNSIESENTRVFSTVCAGPFNFPESEIDEVRFWTVCELRREMGTDSFTPNLSTELSKLFEMKII